MQEIKTKAKIEQIRGTSVVEKKNVEGKIIFKLGF
jgi:hypothetical protein